MRTTMKSRRKGPQLPSNTAVICAASENGASERLTPGVSSSVHERAPRDYRTAEQRERPKGNFEEALVGESMTCDWSQGPPVRVLGLALENVDLCIWRRGLVTVRPLIDRNN
jgi:hypothetical protein